MREHTKEPWKINHDDSTEEWSIVTNQHGSIVANVNEETGPELAGSIPVMRKMPGMENARRIVACVNACAGLPTEQLEASPLGGVLNGVAGLIAQRDQLLAALQDVRGALSSVNSGHQHQITVNDEPAYWQTGEWVRWILDEVLPGVDAAINTTKAE